MNKTPAGFARFRESFLCRGVSVFLITAYFFTNYSGNSFASSSVIPKAPKASGASAIQSSFQVPAQLGKIEETFQGKSSQAVVILQDAHAVADAQRNLWKLIDHFERAYGVKEVMAEGAAGELDAQFFRSFPDKEKLKKVFEEYLQKGELTGPNAAALFSGMSSPDDLTGNSAKFYGIEDWELYEEGLGYFLNAQEKEAELLREIKAQISEIEKEKQKIYSRQLLEIDKALERFYESHDNLETLLKGLVSVRRPAKGSSVEMLLEELRNVKGQWGKDELKREEKYSRMSGRFEREFEAYAQSVKESLLRNDVERKLDRQSRELYLLRKLSKLELTAGEWEELKMGFLLRTSSVVEMTNAHVAFYENAQKRDEVFFEKLVTKQSQSNDMILFVAGGFHSQGLAQKFKESGISYVIVRPEIKDIPDQTIYRQQMQGQVSWSSYFRVKNGKINLSEAFTRAARDKLLNETRDIKSWRDQIIRDLAAKERIAEARNYTRFLDELAPSPQNVDPRPSWKSRLDQFVQGLRKLDAAHQLTEQNILQLFKPSTTLAAAPGNILTGSRSELRADLLSFSRSGQPPVHLALRANHDDSRSEVRQALRMPAVQVPSELVRSEVRILEQVTRMLDRIASLRILEPYFRISSFEKKIYAWLGIDDEKLPHAFLKMRYLRVFLENLPKNLTAEEKKIQTHIRITRAAEFAHLFVLLLGFSTFLSSFFWSALVVNVVNFVFNGLFVILNRNERAIELKEWAAFKSAHPLFFDGKIFEGILGEEEQKKLEQLVAPLPGNAERSEMAEEIQKAYRAFWKLVPDRREKYPENAPVNMVRWIAGLTDEEKPLLRQLFLQLKSEGGDHFKWRLVEASLLPARERTGYLQEKIENSIKKLSESEDRIRLQETRRPGGQVITYSVETETGDPLDHSELLAFAEDAVLALADRGILAWKLKFSNDMPASFDAEAPYFTLRVEDTQGQERYFWSDAWFADIQQDSVVRPLLLEMIRQGFEKMEFGFKYALMMSRGGYNLVDPEKMKVFLEGALSQKRQYDQSKKIQSAAFIEPRDLSGQEPGGPIFYQAGLVINDETGKPLLYSTFDPATERFTDFKPYEAVRSEVRQGLTPAEFWIFGGMMAAASLGLIVDLWKNSRERKRRRGEEAWKRKILSTWPEKGLHDFEHTPTFFSMVLKVFFLRPKIRALLENKMTLEEMKSFVPVFDKIRLELEGWEELGIYQVDRYGEPGYVLNTEARIFIDAFSDLNPANGAHSIRNGLQKLLNLNYENILPRSEARSAPEVSNERPEQALFENIADKLQLPEQERKEFLELLHSAPRPLFAPTADGRPTEQDVFLMLGLIRLWTHPAVTDEFKKALRFAFSVGLENWLHNPGSSFQKSFRKLAALTAVPAAETVTVVKRTLRGFLNEILAAEALHKEGYEILEIGEASRLRKEFPWTDLKAARLNESDEKENFFVEVKDYPAELGRSSGRRRRSFFRNLRKRNRSDASQISRYLQMLDYYQKAGKMILRGQELTAPGKVLFVVPARILERTSLPALKQLFYRELEKMGIQEPEKQFIFMPLEIPSAMSFAEMDSWKKDEKIRSLQERLSGLYKSFQMPEVPDPPVLDSFLPDAPMREKLEHYLKREAADWQLDPGTVLPQTTLYEVPPISLLVSRDEEKDVTGIAVGKEGETVVYPFLVEEGGKHAVVNGLPAEEGMEIKIFKNTDETELLDHWVLKQKNGKYFLSILRHGGFEISPSRDISLDDWSASLLPRSEVRSPEGERLAKGEQLGEGEFKYEIQNLITPTQSSEIYLARHVSSGQEVVLKIQPPSGVDIDLEKLAILEKMQEHEARALGLSEGPGASRGPFAGIGVDPARHFVWMAMEKKEGTALHKWVVEKTQTRKINLFEKILAETVRLHQLGIIHRDLKPDNIMVLDRDQPKIIDFGRSRISNELPPYEAVKRFSPPKGFGAFDAQGSVPPTPAADLFSLGMVLFFLATGDYRFRHSTLAGPALPILYFQVMGQMPSQADIQDQLPAEWKPFAGVIAAAISTKPGEQYPGVFRMLEAYRRARSEVRQALRMPAVPDSLESGRSEARGRNTLNPKELELLNEWIVKAKKVQTKYLGLPHEEAIQKIKKELKAVTRQMDDWLLAGFFPAEALDEKTGDFLEILDLFFAEPEKVNAAHLRKFFDLDLAALLSKFPGPPQDPRSETRSLVHLTFGWKNLKMKLTRKIGFGQNSEIYAAYIEDSLQREEAALKVFSPSEVHDLSFMQRYYLHELKATKRWAAGGNPFSPRYYTAGFDRSNHAFGIVMESVPGKKISLWALSRTPEEIAAKFEESLEGLEELHKRKIIHADLKPEHLLVPKEGKVKIVDLGEAYLDGEAPEYAKHWLLETNEYTAPELSDQNPQATPQSDLFSMGAILFALATGDPLIEGKTFTEYIQSEELLTLAKLASFLSEDWQSYAGVIWKALRFDPSGDFKSAVQMREALTLIREARSEVRSQPVKNEKGESSNIREWMEKALRMLEEGRREEAKRNLHAITKVDPLFAVPLLIARLGSQESPLFEDLLASAGTLHYQWVEDALEKALGDVSRQEATGRILAGLSMKSHFHASQISKQIARILADPKRASEKIQKILAKIIAQNPEAALRAFVEWKENPALVKTFSLLIREGAFPEARFLEMRPLIEGKLQDAGLVLLTFLFEWALQYPHLQPQMLELLGPARAISGIWEDFILFAISKLYFPKSSAFAAQVIRAAGRHRAWPAVERLSHFFADPQIGTETQALAASLMDQENQKTDLQDLETPFLRFLFDQGLQYPALQAQVLKRVALSKADLPVWSAFISFGISQLGSSKEPEFVFKSIAAAAEHVYWIAIPKLIALFDDPVIGSRAQTLALLIVEKDYKKRMIYLVDGLSSPQGAHVKQVLLTLMEFRPRSVTTALAVGLTHSKNKENAAALLKEIFKIRGQLVVNILTGVQNSPKVEKSEAAFQFLLDLPGIAPHLLSLSRFRELTDYRPVLIHFVERLVSRPEFFEKAAPILLGKPYMISLLKEIFNRDPAKVLAFLDWAGEQDLWKSQAENRRYQLAPVLPFVGPGKSDTPEYWAIYKPAGMPALLQNSGQNERTIYQFFQEQTGLFPDKVRPAGWMDDTAEGLMILSSDPKMLLTALPLSHIGKVYRIWVKGEISNEELEDLERGIQITTGRGRPYETRPAEVELVKREHDESEILLTMEEEKKDLIVRMMKEIHHPVLGLRRERFAGIRLEELNLKPGQVVRLEGETLEKLLQAMETAEWAFERLKKERPKIAMDYMLTIGRFDFPSAADFAAREFDTIYLHAPASIQAEVLQKMIRIYNEFEVSPAGKEFISGLFKRVTGKDISKMPVEGSRSEARTDIAHPASAYQMIASHRSELEKILKELYPESMRGRILSPKEVIRFLYPDSPEENGPQEIQLVQKSGMRPYEVHQLHQEAIFELAWKWSFRLPELEKDMKWKRKMPGLLEDRYKIGKGKIEASLQRGDQRAYLLYYLPYYIEELRKEKKSEDYLLALRDFHERLVEQVKSRTLRKSPHIRKVAAWTFEDVLLGYYLDPQNKHQLPLISVLLKHPRIQYKSFPAIPDWLEKALSSMIEKYERGNPGFAGALKIFSERTLSAQKIYPGDEKLRKSLTLHKGNRRRVAADFDVSPTTVHGWIRQHNFREFERPQAGESGVYPFETAKALFLSDGKLQEFWEKTDLETRRWFLISLAEHLDKRPDFLVPSDFQVPFLNKRDGKKRDISSLLSFYYNRISVSKETSQGEALEELWRELGIQGKEISLGEARKVFGSSSRTPNFLWKRTSQDIHRAFVLNLAKRLKKPAAKLTGNDFKEKIFTVRGKAKHKYLYSLVSFYREQFSKADGKEVTIQEAVRRLKEEFGIVHEVISGKKAREWIFKKDDPSAVQKILPAWTPDQRKIDHTGVSEDTKRLLYEEVRQGNAAAVNALRALHYNLLLGKVWIKDNADLRLELLDLLEIHLMQFIKDYAVRELDKPLGQKSPEVPEEDKKRNITLIIYTKGRLISVISQFLKNLRLKKRHAQFPEALEDGGNIAARDEGEGRDPLSENPTGFDFETAARLYREAKTKSENVERNLEVLSLWMQGWAYAEIGRAKGGITRSRIHQILGEIKRIVQEKLPPEPRSEMRKTAEKVMRWSLGEGLTVDERQYSATVIARVGVKETLRELEALENEMMAAKENAVSAEILRMKSALAALSNRKYAVGYSIPKTGRGQDIEDFIQSIRTFGAINRIYVRREETVPDRLTKAVREMGLVLTHRNLNDPRVLSSEDQNKAGLVASDESSLSGLSGASPFLPVVSFDRGGLKDPQISRLVIAFQTAVAILIAEEMQQRSELRFKPAELLKQYGLFAGFEGKIAAFKGNRIEIYSSVIETYLNAAALRETTARSA